MEFEKLLTNGLDIGSRITIELDDITRKFLDDTGVSDLREGIVWGICSDDSGKPDGSLKILILSRQSPTKSTWKDVTTNHEPIQTVSSCICLNEQAIATMVVNARFGSEASAGSVDALMEQIGQDKQKLADLKSSTA